MLVLDPQVLEITVDPVADTIVFGESIQLTETVTVQDGASSDVTWSSSDPNIALVLQDGTVIGQTTAGEVLITATSDFDGTQTATSTILVNEAATVLDVQIDPALGSTIVGSTFQLTVIVTAIGGADESVTWSSSNPSIASVDENGLVMGNALGNVIITAISVFDALQRGTAEITVDAAPAVIEVTIDPTLDTVNVGEIITLEESVVTEGGADASVTWISSDIGIATVDANGIVSGVSRGTVTITATSVFDNTVTGAATVLVLDPQVLDITVDPVADTIVFGESIQLTETVTVQDGASSDVTWSSSDPIIAVVLQDGTVFGQTTPGTVIITVTSDFDGTQVATSTILVNEAATVLDVQIDPALGSTIVGSTFQLTVIVTAIGGADESVTWSSSNPSIASVDENGLVTGNALGNVIITATSVFDALQRGTAEITVDAAPAVIEVTIDPTLDTVNVGETITLEESVVTEGGADESVTWSSLNESRATVDGNGIVSGVSRGTVTITATSVFDNTVTGAATVLVLDPQVLDITVDPVADTIVFGESIQLAATVTVQDGASSDVTWSSSDPIIAVVLQDGTVFGQTTPGTVIITVTSDFDGTQTAISTILVNEAATVLDVQIDPALGSTIVGSTFQLTVIVTAIGGADESVTWSSSNPSIASVDENGLVMGNALGNVIITATSVFDALQRGTAEITVDAAPAVIEVTIDPTLDTVNVGETITLEESVVTEGGADESVTWSSLNESRATVDGNGIVSGVSRGTVTITATSVFDNTVTGAATVLVLDPQVLEITIDPVADTIVFGESIQLTATVTVQDGASEDVTWSSADPIIAVVLQDGTVFGQTTPGTVIITVTSDFDGTQVATSTILVNEAATVLDVQIDPALGSTIVGSTFQLTVIVTAIGGADESVTWSSSNPSIASVDENGLVTGNALGNVIITATSVFDALQRGTAEITVDAAPAVIEVTIDPTLDTVNVGETITLEESVVTEGGADESVTWSSLNESRATVDGNGIVSGVSRGTVTITATSVFDNTVTGAATVLVLDPQVLDITVDPVADTIVFGESIQLAATVTVQDGASSDVTWSSSDPIIAVVLQDGTVFGQTTPGTVIITVTSDFDGTQTAISTILVNEAATVLDVQIDPALGSTIVGSTFQLTVIVTAIGGADESVTWSSSNPSIASVDENGLVTGNALGNVIITATSVFDALQRGTAEITVDAAPAVIEVTIDPTLDTVNVGETITLEESVVTEGGADESVTWSSLNESRATVDGNGIVSGVSRGTVTITATSVFDNTVTGAATVLVLDPQVLEITIDPVADTIVFGESIQLTATVTVQDGASEDVTWSSADPNIALVLQDGTVTGQTTAGAVIITATSDFDGTQTAISTILVNEAASVLDVQINPALASTVVGETVQLTAVVTAVGGANESVTWSSSNDLGATVDANGLVTGVSSGLVIITATSVFDNTEIGNSTINVDLAPEVLEVTITPLIDTVSVGSTISLTENVTAVGGADESVTWSSLNESRATVDGNGIVSGVSRGTVTITATSVFDNTVTGAATVLVLDPQVLEITIDPVADTIVFGESIQLAATVTVQDGASEDVTWSSADPNIALVLQDGTVTGQTTAGTVIITATSDFDGTQTAISTILVNEAASVLDVQINPALASTVVGETVQLTAVVTAVGGADESVTWSSSNDLGATVDANGLVTGVSSGLVIITATSVFDNTEIGNSTINVDLAPEVLEVTITPLIDTVSVGSTISLTENVTAVGGADESVTWSSLNESRATVDGNGIVSGVSRGTVTITATSVFDNTVTGAATVLVLDPQVLEITIDPVADTIVFGESIQLAATVTVQDGASEDVTWSSANPNIALVLQDGTVTGQTTAGTVIITATSDFDGTQTAISTILVNEAASVLDVQINPALASTVVGETVQLTAVVTAVGGADESVTWSSSNDLGATVDANGLVTGVSSGLVIITATSVFDNTEIGNSTINVDLAPEVLEVTITPLIDTVSVGSTISLTENVTAVGGADESVTWSSLNESRATVDANGIVSGVSRGTVTITATSVFDNTVTGAATVLVLDPQVLEITIDPVADTIVFGESIQLAATVTVQDGASEDVTWSSADPNIALVLQDGTVTGQTTAGTVIITATSDFDGTQTAISTILVNEAASVLDVQINPALASTVVGETVQLTAVVTAVGGADESVTWSSSNDLGATVDANGLVTGVSSGLVIITATSVFDNTEIGNSTINVDLAPEVLEVTITPLIDTVSVGSTISLTENVTAVGGADESVTWSSLNESRATVDGNGIVSGVSRGTVTITATSVFDNTVTGAATVLVLDPQVLEITIDPVADTIVFGESIQLAATVTVQDGASEDVTWSSADPNIALVLQDGTVTGQTTAGAVIITATSDFDGTQTAISTILVNEAASVLDVQINPALASTVVGETVQLTAVVTAVGGANESVTWSSSNDLGATVDANGLVTGVSSGLVIITATSVFDNTEIGNSTINVDLAPEVLEVTITPLIDTVSVGSTISLTENVTAVGGADESVTWSSLNESRATVDANGIVSGVSRGTVTITATSVFDNTVTGAATVLVLDPQVLEITIDPVADTIVFGESIQLAATVTVQDGASEDVTWSSADPNIALVLQDGTVTGQTTAGAVIITATSDFDGTQTAISTILVNEAASVLDVQINPALASTVVGETVQLTAVVTAVGGADESVTWSSSNDLGATVDANGLVTGVCKRISYHYSHLPYLIIRK